MPDHSNRAALPRVPALVLAALLGILAVAGWLHQKQQSRDFRQQAEKELLAIADLKAREVASWREERAIDAETVFTNPALGSDLETLPVHDLASRYESWLQRFGHDQYDNVVLVDRAGRVLLSRNDRGLPLSPHAQAFVQKAIATQQITFSDLLLDERNEPHLDIVAPMVTDAGHPASGAVLFRVDPSRHLFPLVQSWPAPSPTAESLLLRRDGDSALLLSEARHRKGTALALRVPLSDRQSPSARAALGFEGIVEGRDYRGVPVFSAIRRVPDSPWILEAKVDSEEVMAPARERARLNALVVLLAFAAAASGLLLWWRSEKGHSYRQRYEAELERQGLVRRIEDLSRHTNDMLLLVDPDQNIIQANDRATELLGYTREELLRLNIRHLRDPDTLTDLERRIQEERAAGKAVYETRYRRKDGSTFPVEVSARVLEIDGKTYHQGTFRDISDRKRVEEQRAFQVQLLDTLHEAVIGCDAGLRIRSWNAAAERLYGWSAAEVIGRPSREVLRTEFADDKSGKHVAAELNALGRARAQVVQYHRDGRRIEVECEGSTLRRPDGRIGGYVVASRDLTERKRAEEALRASEAKFRAAFHGAGMGILLVDRQARIFECNRAFGAMLGYGDEELRGRSLSDLIHPDELQRGLSALREMVEGKSDAFTVERRYRRKDGEWAHAILRVTAVRDPSGDFAYSIGVVEDVTQKKAMEAQLLLADRMSSMGTLAAGVAHEINNPLAFVVANVSYALEELRRPGGRTEDSARALEEALEGSARVREIVRDLKTFSRPDEKCGDAVDVRQVLRSSINLAQNEIHHRARLVADLGDVPPVAASAHRVGQVFLNLLINAAQSIPEGHADRNEIRVATRLSDDGRIVVEIADTGAGIAPEYLSRIFEPFFTTKPVGVGTGLGLSICHGIVTGLGGEIRVQSRLGAGSTFQVFLPAAKAPSEATGPAPPAPLPAARGRILVVDDEAMVGRAVGRVLSPAHEVVALTSARAALTRLLEDGTFDVILCDLMMPEMTGMELHRQLANIAPALSDRMVFLTGGAFTPDAREFLARVPNARVEKPFEPQALRALVAEILSHSPTPSAIP